MKRDPETRDVSVIAGVFVADLTALRSDHAKFGIGYKDSVGSLW